MRVAKGFTDHFTRGVDQFTENCRSARNLLLHGALREKQCRKKQTVEQLPDSDLICVSVCSTHQSQTATVFLPGADPWNHTAVCTPPSPCALLNP
eukprot:304705-Amphidinium_carterae.2